MNSIFNTVVLVGLILVNISYGLDNKKLTKLYAKNDKPIGIIGAPFWMGAKKEGTELAPDLFRKQHIVNQIKRLGYEKVDDHGNLEFKVNPKDKTEKHKNNFTEIHNQFTVSDAIVLVEKKVEEILKKKETVVTLGGDHSLTAGSILGHKKVNSKMCVILVAAHGEVNHCESTTSGNFHGMPLSFVIKGMEKLHKNFKACPAMNVTKPSVDASDVVLIGSRDMDDSEIEIINKLKISHYSMKDIDEIGIKETVNQILKTVCKSKSIHVSFAVNAIDTIYTPNTLATVFGGLTVREVLQMAEMIANTKKLSVIDMLEVNTKVGPKDWAQNTVNIAMNIILSFLGKSREIYWGKSWEGGWGGRKDL